MINLSQFEGFTSLSIHNPHYAQVNFFLRNLHSKSSAIVKESHEILTNYYQ